MFEIIPAIDLIDGKCVRLAQGDFERSVFYSENPLEIAVRIESAGLRRLHLVDLDGSRDGRLTNLRTLEKIARASDLTIDFGGGIKTDVDIQTIFEAGAAIVSVGSMAVRDPEKFLVWLERYGGERILLGADARSRKIAIDGWQTATDLDVLEFLKDYFACGVKQAFCTDIERDGLLAGAANELYGRIVSEIPDLKLYASGGVGSLADIRALERIGCAGVIVGKAFFEGRIKLEEIYAG